jgi:hypothetical protein
MIAKRTIFINVFLFIIIPFLFGIFCSNLVSVVPLNSLTESRLISLERNIKYYFQEKGEIPKSLNVMIEDNFITREDCIDAWGNEISFIPSDDGKITLISYGDPYLSEIDTSIRYNLCKSFKIDIKPTLREASESQQ